MRCLFGSGSRHRVVLVVSATLTDVKSLQSRAVVECRAKGKLAPSGFEIAAAASEGKSRRAASPAMPRRRLPDGRTGNVSKQAGVARHSIDAHPLLLLPSTMEDIAALERAVDVSFPSSWFVTVAMEFVLVARAHGERGSHAGRQPGLCNQAITPGAVSNPHRCKATKQAPGLDARCVARRRRSPPTIGRLGPPRPIKTHHNRPHRTSPSPWATRSTPSRSSSSTSSSSSSRTRASRRALPPPRSTPTRAPRGARARRRRTRSRPATRCRWDCGGSSRSKTSTGHGRRATPGYGSARRRWRRRRRG